MFIEYRRPCATAIVRDGFAAHVARGSVLPGTDYACKTGDHAFAAADGTVTAVDLNPNDARGMSLIIKFRDGRVGEYLHLSRIYVKVGQRVKKGDTVALTGNTGTTSTGPHLHFSFRTRLGRLIDFVPFLNANERNAEKRRKRRRRRGQPE